MAKQYIPGVSGLLTEPNPVDAPSNTLSNAENVIVEQGGKVQARHGLNVDHQVNTVDTGHYLYLSVNPALVYIYCNFFNINSPFLKLIQYQNSNNEYKNLLIVKKDNTYGYTPNNENTGVYRNTTDLIPDQITVLRQTPVYEYYSIDDTGEITKTNYFKYNEIANAFTTKDTFYIQTENGLADASIETMDDKIERYTTAVESGTYFQVNSKIDNFFDISWPAFPQISYTLKSSNTFKDWLKSGNKCALVMTFYREMGYSDKEQLQYESAPSDPILIVNYDYDANPIIYIDFRVDTTTDPYDPKNPLYKSLNQYTKLNYGRKFGIKLYRTKSDSITKELSPDYDGCFSDISFDNFMIGETFFGDPVIINNKSFFILETGAFEQTIPLLYDAKLELNIGDIVSINNSIDTPNAIKSADTLVLDGNYPSRFSTTDIDILKNDYQPARLKVVDKILINNLGDPFRHNKYAYVFESINYIYTNETFTITKDYDNNSVEDGGGYLFTFDAFAQNPPTNTIIVNGQTVLIRNNSGNFGLYYIRNAVTVGLVTTFNVSETPTGDLVQTLNFPYTTTLSHIFLPNTTIDYFSRLRSSVNINPLVLSRSFIISLDINDSGLTEFQSLYTNSGNDGADNTNRFIPYSNKSIKYKDFWIYSGLKQPLEAKMYVISQPNVYQTKLYTDASYKVITTPSFLRSYNFYSKDDLKLPLVTNSVTDNGQRFFIDCPIYPKQDVELSNISILPPLTTDESNKYLLSTNRNSLFSKVYEKTCSIDSVSGELRVKIQQSSTDPSNIWTNNTRISFDTFLVGYAAGTAFYIQNYQLVTISSITYHTFKISLTPNGSKIAYSGSPLDNFCKTLNSAASSYYHNATIFEQAKLTLRLYPTESLEDFEEISIKTVPLYNRRGYYNKYTNNGTIDNRAYEFDLSLKESNGISSNFYYNDTLVSISNSANVCSVYNLPGNKQGQAVPDGRIAPMTADSTQNITYVSSTSTLTLKNVTGTISEKSNILNIQNFPQPGYMLITWADATTNRNPNGIIFSYSNYEASSDGTNSYIFKNAKIVMSPESIVSAVSPTTWYFLLTETSVAHIYTLDGSSINALALYPYSLPPDISSVSFTTKTINNINYYTVDKITYTQTSTNESIQTASFIKQPYFTLIPHNKKSKLPIATLSPDGNAKFRGGESFGKTEGELLDEYTYNIVNQFNKELSVRGIKAYLYKGSSLGEIGIVYPDGHRIEMRNDYGGHQFEPNINTNDSDPSGRSFAVIAEKTNNDYNSKNEIIWSRREIPEITTGLLYAKLGKNDKNVIGFGANVDDLYIFKEDGIWRATDSGPAFPGDQLPAMGITVFSNTFICQAEGSIQEINDEIIFLSQYGFASIVNGGIQLIDGAINRDILTLLSISVKSRIRSYVNKSKNLYYCTLINEVDASLPVKSGTYIFNTKTRQWSFMDEEILSGIETYDGKNMTVYRQKLVNAKYAGKSAYTGPYTRSMYDFSESLDNQNRITRATEDVPVEAYYIAAEQHTNKIRNNAKDQYDYSGPILEEAELTKLNPAFDNYGQFRFPIENLADYYFTLSADAYQNRSKFKTAIKDCLVDSATDTLTIGDNVKIIDSFVSLFINRTLYLQKINETNELYAIKIKRTSTLDEFTYLYFDFIDSPPQWFTELNYGPFSGTDAQYRILAGVPASITFNPESGNSPDSNKLFQEYMIHTETANKGALMSFKTDSQSNFTKDRRFVYDANATNRNVFRTYVPREVARGRYLIRQIKHDLPLENLIITGQTVVMRDSGSTRVQKDKDNQ